MSGPDSTPGLGDVAAEPPAESVAAEKQVVDGDQDDTGDAVPSDHAQ